MSYCKYCGKEIKPNEEHKCASKPSFTHIVSWLFDKSGVENPFRNPNEIYERNKKIAPDCISLDDGEVPVKQYNVGILRSRMRFQRSEGRLQITNKRILFRGTGYSPAGKTIYQHAFSIDKIDGIEIHKDRRLRIPDLLFAISWDIMSTVFHTQWASFIQEGLGIGVFGSIIASLIIIAFAVVALIHFFWKPQKFFSKLLFTGIARGGVIALMSVIFKAAGSTFSEILAGPFLALFGLLYLVLSVMYYVSMFLFVIKPNLMIEIKTSSGSPGIQIKHKEISFIWHKSETFSGFTEILPWKDTDLAIKEVSAIIEDIKTLGNMGIEKWQEIE